MCVIITCDNIYLKQGTAGQEAEVGQEMSALVIYIQPIRFHGFEYADSKLGREIIFFIG